MERFQMLKTNFKILLGLTATLALLTASETEHYNLGTIVDKSVYQNWDIDVSPTSKHLVKGQGTAEQGKEIFAVQCASCHGPKGEGIKWDPNNGAFPALIDKNKDLKKGKSLGNYWPYASTLYDYINRAMPITTPGSLSSDEVYALTAFILSENGVIKQGLVLSDNNLNTIKMPNKDGFICDNRPVYTGILCMENCKTPKDKDFNLVTDPELLKKISPVPVTDCYLK